MSYGTDTGDLAALFNPTPLSAAWLLDYLPTPAPEPADAEDEAILEAILRALQL